MKIDASVDSNPSRIGDQALRAEKLGYDGIRVAETNREPFLPLTLAAQCTSEVELVTSVVVAFARNPMLLAMQAHELNVFSNQRLVLGIGSQVKPHIERRFSMPWHKPARQMREFISAMYAIFACWYDGERLEYQGEYYRYDLMPTTFRPPEHDVRRPRVILSATGPLMTKVAAELADGMIAHPFSSLEYLKEVTLPAIEEGLAKSGRSCADFQLDYSPMLAVGVNEESLSRQVTAVRDRIAFYGCTVAYRPVLELHGWGALQDELITLNRQHRTKEMRALITDEILHTIAIVGSSKQVATELGSRLNGIVDRTGFQAPDLSNEDLATTIKQLRG